MLVFSWHIWCFSVCIWGLCRKKGELKEGILNWEWVRKPFLKECLGLILYNYFPVTLSLSTVWNHKWCHCTMYTNKPRLVLLRSFLLYHAPLDRDLWLQFAAFSLNPSFVSLSTSGQMSINLDSRYKIFILWHLEGRPTTFSLFV